MPVTKDTNGSDWLRKLGKLNPAISRHKLNGTARYAPHKPLLLLCILDLAESGELKSPELGKTPELYLRFDSYWALVQERWGGRPGLGQPFHYLNNQGFWQVLGDDGRAIRREIPCTKPFVVYFLPHPCLEPSSKKFGPGAVSACGSFA